MAKRISYRFDTHLGIDMTGNARGTHFAALSGMVRRHSEKAGATGSTTLERTAGYRRLLTANGSVHTLMSADGGDTLIIHAGTRLYAQSIASLPSLPTPREAIERRSSLGSARLLTLAGKDANGTACTLADMADDAPIAHATVDGTLYFLSHGRLFCYEGGALYAVCDESTPTVIGGVTVTACKAPYVPTVRLDGMPCEQRNLLTRYCYLSATLGKTLGEDGANGPFTYERTEDVDGVPCCRLVSATRAPLAGFLYVPEAARVDGVVCAVTDIASDAFKEARATAVRFPSSLKSIVPSAPYEGFETVKRVYVPYGILLIDPDAFEKASTLHLHYEGTFSEWLEVEKLQSENVLGLMHYQSPAPYRPLSLTLGKDTAIESLVSCTLDGAPYKSDTGKLAYALITQADGTQCIYLLVHTAYVCTGHEIAFRMLCAMHRYAPTGGALSHPLVHDGESIEAMPLALSSRLMVSFEGRLFFGAPTAAAHAVFYTHAARDGTACPLYLASENFITDGTDDPVTALTAAEGELFVIRTPSEGDRSTLTVHAGDAPEDSAALFLRIYPALRCISVPRVFAATVGDGTPHLLTSKGLYSCTRQTSGGYLSLKMRSSRVLPLLVSAEHALFSVLDGALMIYTGGGSALLADTQYTEDAEYEWYPLDGIGSYTGDGMLFSPMTALPHGEGYRFVMSASGSVHELVISPTHAPCTQDEITFLTLCNEDGTPHPEGKCIPCTHRTGYVPMDTYGEASGGTLAPPISVLTLGARSFFGTQDGGVFLWNTDSDGKRDHLFDCHKTRAFLLTFPFDGAMPEARKVSVKGSSFLFMKEGKGYADVAVIYDGVQSQTVRTTAHARLAFDMLDFSRLSFALHGSVPTPIFEDGKSYHRKSYLVSSTEPFGFEGLAFTMQTVL